MDASPYWRLASGKSRRDGFRLLRIRPLTDRKYLAAKCEPPRQGCCPRSLDDSREGSPADEFLPEAFQSRSLRFEDFEYRQELGDLKQVLNLFGQVQKLQSPLLIGQRGKSADQRAES